MWCVCVCVRMLEEIICVYLVGWVCVCVNRSSYDSVCLCDTL